MAEERRMTGFSNRTAFSRKNYFPSKEQSDNLLREECRFSANSKTHQYLETRIANYKS